MKRILFCIVTLSLLSHSCLAEDYLPLEIGNRWDYTSPEGDETREVARTIELWGFWREDESWGYLYDPPVPLVDAPLYLGKSWTHAVSLTTSPGTGAEPSVATMRVATG